jgi:hypothetical protein
VLDSAPLLGRKLKQYSAWRTAAVELAEADRIRRAPDAAILERARAELTAVSRYRPGPPTLPVIDRDGDARAALVAVLRTWASEAEGPLSCNAYARAAQGHRHWPTRNTFARIFGSWHGALAAAGLSTRAARVPRSQGGEMPYGL